MFWKHCKVCRRDINWTEVRSVAIRVKLFGCVRYGVCVCGMEAQDPKNESYRRRWRKAAKEAAAKVKSASVTRGISRKKEARKP